MKFPDDQESRYVLLENCLDSNVMNSPDDQESRHEVP